MPSINLRKPVYDELIRQGRETVDYENSAMTEHISEEFDVEVEA